MRYAGAFSLCGFWREDHAKYASLPQNAFGIYAQLKLYVIFETCFSTIKNIEMAFYVKHILVAVAHKFVSQHLSGAGSSPAGSVGRDLNLQKLNYQYLTTSVAVVLVVR